MDPHKQYLQVCIIGNYMFHFGLPGTCHYGKSRRYTCSGAGFAGARQVCFGDLNKDILLEVEKIQCS